MIPGAIPAFYQGQKMRENAFRMTQVQVRRKMLLCTKTRANPGLCPHPKAMQINTQTGLDPGTGIRSKHPDPHENPGKTMRLYK